MDATFDQNGDIDRQSFLVEVVNGKQVIKRAAEAQVRPASSLDVIPGEQR